MKNTTDSTGETHHERRVMELRKHLAANNGIKGLEILKPAEVDKAVTLFRRDGFVVVGDVLSNQQINFLAKGCDEVMQEITALDGDHKGNRGSHRYSFGGSSLTRSQLHRPEWQMLLDIPAVTTMVSAIFGNPGYTLRAASRDFCLPGAVDYQILHSDIRDWSDIARTPFNAFHDPVGHTSIRDLPTPYICVNFLPQDVTRLNGPTRQIPGTQNTRARISSLAEEPEWMRLSTQGKIIYVGSRNFPGWAIARANEKANARHQLGLVSAQSLYNLIERRAELEVLPAYREYGLGVIPWSPLAGGLLAGPGDATGGRRQSAAALATNKHASQLQRFAQLCEAINETPSATALAGLLHQPGITSTIIGPATAHQLSSVSHVPDIRLDEDTRRQINAIFPPCGQTPEACAG